MYYRLRELLARLPEIPLPDKNSETDEKDAEEAEEVEDKVTALQVLLFAEL